MSGPRFERPDSFDVDKQRLIDVAVERCRPRSFADLGGVWNVEGAYARDARLRCGVERVVLADSDFDERTRTLCSAAGVEVVQGLLGDPATIEAVGAVDVAFVSDVLLHQVHPDWDAFLAAYAPHVGAFAIFNPQWPGGAGETFRLVDLGPERYFELVPHAADEPGYDRFFERLDESYPEHARPVRDVHYAWQWAITDADLRDVLQTLGYSEAWSFAGGAFAAGSRFERRGFLFMR